MSLVADLFPDFVAAAEDDIRAATGPLYPEEAAHVARAVERRRNEFRAGRALARRALAALGATPGPIPAAADGSPVWPPGYIGSISHSRRRAVAVVARSADLRSVGVDLEEIGRFRPELEAHFLRSEEIALNLDGLAPIERQRTGAILFSAKEAFYKCQHPLTKEGLHFHDASVRIDHDSRSFELQLLRPLAALGGCTVFHGRFNHDLETVAACVLLRNGSNKAAP